MKTRAMTKREREIIWSELDNAALADCHSPKTAELISRFSTLVCQGKVRVVTVSQERIANAK